LATPAMLPLLQQAAQRLGAGGVAGPEGQPGGGGGDTNLAGMASELHGADPTFLLNAMQSIKKQLSQLFVQSSMRLPNVSGNIAKTMTALDRAIKEAQQAASTQSVVRSPVGFSLAGARPQATGGESGAGGGMGPF